MHIRRNYFLHLGRSYLVVILFLLLNNFPTTIAKDEYYPTISQIVPHFSGCELVFLEAAHVNFSNNFQLDKVIRSSSGAYQITNHASISFKRHSDIQRYTKSHCSLAIFFFREYSQHIETWLVKTLLPRYAPIIRKDHDHFIFVTHSEKLSDQILHSPNFGARIKFKISLFNSSNRVTCKAVDLYGGLNGETQLKTVNGFPGQIDSLDELFPDMTTQFNGKVFRFSIPNVAFRLEITSDPNGKYHPVRGFYKWYFDQALRKFNFTYDMFRATGGGTGKQLENGTWIGALGDVLYGRADFSTMIGLVYSRHKYIGWSSALSYEWMIFVTPSPKKSYSPKAIYGPFTPLMWLLFSVTLAVVTLALQLVGRSTFYGEGRTKQSLLSWFGYVFATFLEQDRNGPVKASSVRVLSSFWLLFAMVTATAYRGKLVGLIAFPVNTWIPVTFEELANSHFKAALNVVGKGGAAYDWMVSSPNPIIRKLAARVEYIGEGEKCLERAMNEELGCMIWKGISDYLKVKHLTDRNGHVPLVESEGTAMFIKDGWNFEKRAIFGHTFDRTIQNSVQMGLSLKWFQLDQDFIKKERNERNRRSSNFTEIAYEGNQGPKKLVLSQFVGLFIISVVGVIFASVQFIMEISYCFSKL